MSAGDGSKQQNQDRQTKRRRNRILQQLQPDVVRGELLCGDPGADHHRDQQRGAGELGEQTPRQRDGTVHVLGAAGLPPPQQTPFSAVPASTCWGLLPKVSESASTV